MVLISTDMGYDVAEANSKLRVLVPKNSVLLYVCSDKINYKDAVAQDFKEIHTDRAVIFSGSVVRHDPYDKKQNLYNSCPGFVYKYLTSSAPDFGQVINDGYFIFGLETGQQRGFNIYTQSAANFVAMFVHKHSVRMM